MGGCGNASCSCSSCGCAAGSCTCGASALSKITCSAVFTVLRNHIITNKFITLSYKLVKMSNFDLIHLKASLVRF
ncbi:hypothetical protein JADG_001841 [Aureobasidium aubasidani]|nr:hypothetical protein JADG_001840 [Aureobasidium pullulans]KAG2162102.1 hypothetical protein JADG_001841 [Aureobasidium pullulans]